MHDPTDLHAPHNPTRLLAAAIIGLLVVAILSVGGYWVWVWVSVAAEDTWEPVHEAEVTTLGGVDLARVHAEGWARVCTSERGTAESAEAFAAVRSAVAGDETLAGLVDGLREADGLAASERFGAQRALVGRWNGYLAEKGVPLELQIPIHAETRPRFPLCVLAYAIVTDVEVVVGERRVRTRLGSREDSLNIVEGYLGHASDETLEAFIAIDTTADEGASRIWPLLDSSAPGERTKVERRFQARVKAELMGVLPGEHAEGLVEFAPHRRTLVDLHRKIDGRRSCGSRWSMSPFVPLRGYGDGTLDQLRSAARGPGADCPPLYHAEYERLREASWALRHGAGVRGHVRALTAVMARGVVIHEVRHVLDAHEGLTCADCPQWLDETGRRELSAYLATLAYSRTPHVELFQVCQMAETGGGPHGRAARLIVSKMLDRGCDGLLPVDINAAARELEVELFGRTTPIALPESFPSLLPSHRY